MSDGPRPRSARAGGSRLRESRTTRREFIAGIAAAGIGAAIGCASDSAAPPGPGRRPPVVAPPLRTSSVLAELLAENRTRDPEYGGGLANHQSMALVALTSLGADDDRLREYAATHGRKLRPLRADSASVPWARWTDAIG